MAARKLMALIAPFPGLAWMASRLESDLARVNWVYCWSPDSGLSDDCCSPVRVLTVASLKLAATPSAASAAVCAVLFYSRSGERRRQTGRWCIESSSVVSVLLMLLVLLLLLMLLMLLVLLMLCQVISRATHCNYCSGRLKFN